MGGEYLRGVKKGPRCVSPIFFIHTNPSLLPVIMGGRNTAGSGVIGWLGLWMGAKHGCFKILIRASSSYKLGSGTTLTFQVTQHTRDEVLMRGLVDYWAASAPTGPLSLS